MREVIQTMKIEKSTKLKSMNDVSLDDLKLINKCSLKQLTPEEVFTCSVILCDNEIDRDIEKFTDSSLDKLATLFLGKTGIFNHSWDANDQIARIYRTVVENGKGKNKIGEQIRQLKADIYLLRDGAEDVIQKIEGGILKEVSVGFRAETLCSICGEGFSYWSGECKEGHKKGEKYDKQYCYGSLENPTDAYEFSFVAVPAQKGAGITKKFTDADFSSQWKKFKEMWDGVSISPEGWNKVILDIQNHMISAEEKKKRQLIIAENKKFLEEITGGY